MANKNQTELDSFDTNRKLLGVQEDISKELKKQEDTLFNIVNSEALRYAQAKKKENLTADEVKAVTDVYIVNKQIAEEQKNVLVK